MIRRVARAIMVGFLAWVLLVPGWLDGVPASALIPVSSQPTPTWQTYGNTSEVEPSGRVRSIITVGDTAYFGGYFTQVRPPGNSTELTTRGYLAAIDVTTGNLTPWNPTANGRVWALAYDPTDNRIYVGGAFTAIGGQAIANIAAIDATTGAVITSFAPRVNGMVKAIVIGSDRIFVGGSFKKVDGQPQAYLAALWKDTGRLVGSWRPVVAQLPEPCPPRCTPEVDSLALDLAGSSLYVGGHFGLVNGVNRNNAARVDIASGALLPWNPSILVPYPKNPNQKNIVYDIAVAPNRVYLCGDWYKVNYYPGTTGKVSPNLAGVDPETGVRDPAWSSTGTDGGTPACSLSADGATLFIGGHFGKVGNWSNYFDNPGAISRSHLAAISTASGARVEPWNPWVNAFGLHTIATMNDGVVLIGGDFSRTGGGSKATSSWQQGFALFR